MHDDGREHSVHVQARAHRLTDIAQRLETQIKKPADIDTAAKEQGLTVQETGFFARDEPILGVGAAPEMTARAFEMNKGEVSGPIRTGRGYVFETLTDKQDPHDAKLEEVKERVRDEVTRQRAREMAKQQGSGLAA